MENVPHQPPIAGTIYGTLGAEMKGVANALVALTEEKTVRTIGELIDTVQSNINEVGSLQFETHQPNRGNRLNIVSDPAFDETTVIVSKELINEAIEKLRGEAMNQLAA
ncbi:MAG: hypothetical protein QF793_00635 [Candidatus Peribacteraceae bacterium]|jgi:hypothetical protein|nr:hypothetical protein [Candidatus Peribacteraceae bacterium]|tara:strand:+ start:15019 stop:15345 length:327 start_codon:yes stop_codon:yes gene_type:complete